MARHADVTLATVAPMLTAGKRGGGGERCVRQNFEVGDANRIVHTFRHIFYSETQAVYRLSDLNLLYRVEQETYLSLTERASAEQTK